MSEKIMGVLAVFCAGFIMFKLGSIHGSSIKTVDMIQIYDQGMKEALKTSPRPSLELEMTCANIWAGRVAPPEVLR